MSWHPRITSSLTYWSTRTPDAIALECGDALLSWRELSDAVESLAAKLKSDGIKAGDRVGYLCDNSIEVIQLILATVSLDAVIVPLNVRLSTSELAWIIDDSDLSAVLGDQGFIEHLDELRSAHPMTFYWQGVGRPDWATPLNPSTSDPAPTTTPILGRTTADEDRVAFISYTSGTTGRPKGAMLTHVNFQAAAISFAMTEGMVRSDTSLLVLPLAFTGSLMATWAPAYYSGSRFIIHPRFSAVDTLRELASGKVTVFAAVPVVFEQLAALDDFDGADLSRVRVAKAGGAPPSAATLDRYVRRGIPIGQGYGMTESTGVGTSLPQEDFERKAGSVGVTNLGIELRIVSPDGEDLPLREVGEIWLRGPAVMAGYWNNPVATAETLTDGWLHTGDLGSRDEDGYISIVGREKDMVLSGGLNVYPSEIERVLSLVDGVEENAVVAVPDEKWGEVPLALVVSTIGVLEEDLRAFCRTELADYKIPKYFVIQTEPLPRTMSGKISKSQIRQSVLEAGSMP